MKSAGNSVNFEGGSLGWRTALRHPAFGLFGRKDPVRHLFHAFCAASYPQVGIRVFEGASRRNHRVGSTGTPMKGVETTMEPRKCTRVIHRSSCGFLGNAHNSETYLPLVFLPSFLLFFPFLRLPLAALNFEPSATMHTPRQCRPTIRLRLHLRQMRFWCTDFFPFLSKLQVHGERARPIL